jgi:hypothetical protein
MSQLSLFEMPEPQPIAGVSRKGGIEAAFTRFHEANPHVYTAVRYVALWAVKNGRKLGMKAIYERVRWEYNLQTADEPYRLNNNYTAHYARLLMEQEPELVGYFEIRKSKKRR